LNINTLAVKNQRSMFAYDTRVVRFQKEISLLV